MGTQRLLLLAVQRGQRGLLDDLLVTALHAAVADASVHTVPAASATTCTSTCRPPGIAHSRNTVASPAVFGRLRARALEGLVELLRGADQPDAAAAAARGGLDHQRVADRLGVLAGLLQAGHRAAAPGRGGTPTCSASRLDSILSPSLRMTSADRADEGDPEPVAQLGDTTDDHG